MSKPTFKLQAICDNHQPWPYIGNAFQNKNGSFSLYLDRGVKVVLADGTLLEANDERSVKLYLRPARSVASDITDTEALA